MLETLVRPVEIGEILTGSQEMEGAQGRILWTHQAGIDPNYHVPDSIRNPAEQFTSFDNRNYNPYEATLYERRKEYWAGREEKTLDARYAAWEQDLVNWSHTEESRWVRESMDEFFTQIGMDNVRDHGFDGGKLAKLYDRYFKLPQDADGNEIPLDKLKGKEGIEKRGFKLFMDDAIKLVTKPDGKIDMDHWHRIAPAMEKFSEVFGEPPGDFTKNITMNLAEAELKYKDNPNKFVELQNNEKRLNKDNLKTPETSLLNEIKKKGGSPEPLPFDKESTQKIVLGKIDKYDRTFFEAGTGTGKTTRIAPMVYEKLMHADDKFLCSVPFKLNASSTAEFMASLLGVKVGEEVGWMHGDDKTQRDPRKERILVLTEGTAVHMIRDMDESSLNKVVGNNTGKLFFMVDEIHKLTKPGVELTYALMKMQEKFPNRVKLIFATATGQKDVMQDKLNIENDATHKVEGIAFDVKPVFATEQPGRITATDLLKMKSEERNARIGSDATEKLKEIFASGKAKNVMVALPGLGEIEAVHNRVNALKQDPAYKDNQYVQTLEIVWIHGGSTDEERKAVTEGTKTVPPCKLILCTPAAETGVTFNNLTHGIGTGLVRDNFFNAKLGMNELRLVLSSKAQYTQIKGRLGRTEIGEFYYLYDTEAEYNSRQEFSEPESVRTELADSVLSFMAMGVKDISKIKALTEFPEEQVKHAKIVLRRIGAIDENDEVTAEGKIMQEIPTDYHLARAIAEAKKNNNHEQMLTLAAVMGAMNGTLFVNLNKGNPDAHKDAIYAKRKELRDKVLFGQADQGIPGINTSEHLVLLKLWREYENEVLMPIVGTKILYDEDALPDDKKVKLSRAKDKFCAIYGLSKAAMDTIEQNKMKLTERLFGKTVAESVNRSVWALDVRKRDELAKWISIAFEDRRFRRIGNTQEFEMVHNPMEDDDAISWQRPTAMISTKNNVFEPFLLPTTPGLTEIVPTSLNINRRADGSEVHYLSNNQEYKAA